MYQRKLMDDQINQLGVRIGDCCSIFPFQGRKKAFTLKRKTIDLVSGSYRPINLSMSYIELPKTEANNFHYRLELDHTEEDRGRFILKTLEGRAFRINGLAAREAYVERPDRLYIDDNKINFSPFDLGELLKKNLEHPILLEQKLLQSELNILISGETGTGKSHLAKKIHEASGRSGPFVAINLSSLNPLLIESELFGHKKGSFTGAICEKVGAFSSAEFGTLFLDEIDSLPLDVQTKLLTFLDSKKFRKVGETKETSIKTRLIFASGRALQGLVEQGLFRKDFYFRLKSGHSLELNSLRNDINKIKEACQHYALENEVSFTPRLLEFYQTLAWPGNLRQLLGHLDKKKVLSKSEKIDFDYMDEELLLQSSDLMSLHQSMDIIPMERLKINYIKRVLGLCEGNVALAARRLGVNHKTIKASLQRD